MSSPGKANVQLKSTTKVSLNDRFTSMLKNKQPPSVNVRATIQQQHSATARNRRLAQQMENRTSVQAALQTKPARTLKQRLGVQARLGFQARGGFATRGFATRGFATRGFAARGFATRGFAAARGGMMTRGFAATGFRGMIRGGVRGRGRGVFLRGAMSFRGVTRGRGGPTRLAGRRGMRQRGGQVNRAGVLVSRGATGIGGRGRGRGRGVGLRGRGAFAGRGGGRGRSRGGGRGAGRGGGRGAGRGAGGGALTREQLDNQLDAYMSKTKGHLDAELDAYMAQAEDME